MIKPLLVVAATACVATACGSSSSGNADAKAAESAASAIRSEAALGASAAGTAASASSGSSTDPASVDVCSLLSQDDAIAVVRADGLDPAQTASTTYTFTAAKPADSDGTAACRFSLGDGAQEGTVTFETQPGSAIAEYNDGKKVPGLGDEAYTNANGGTVVRVGSVLLTEGDDAFDSQITLDMLRKMAPHLR